MRPSTTPTGRRELLRRPHRRGGEAGLVGVELRHRRRVVHVAEVRRVDAVLRHLLPGGADLVGRGGDRRPVGVVGELRERRHLPHRRHRLVGVVPGEGQAVDLAHRVGAQAGLLVDPLRVGDLDVGALGVEPPPVERARDAALLHRAAVAEVGAEVRAEGVLHVEVAELVAPADEVAAEVVHRLRRAGRELVRVADAEPAERDREREARPLDGGHSLNTRSALVRRNFGHTSSLNGTLGSSAKMRSSDRPIGK